MKTRNLYPIVTLGFILLDVMNLNAQSEGYENRYIITEEAAPFDSFRYGLFVPPNYDSAIGHHLMLWLHGGGYTADDDHSWYQPEWQEKHPTIVLTPKCYDSQKEEGRRAPWGDSWVMEERWCIAMAFRALDSILREYNIDTTRMHVAGSSMGAVGTLYVLASRPGMFASAYSESAASDPKKAHLMKNTPLWMFHGGSDGTIPTEQSRNMYHAIRNSGGTVVRYKEYRGVGHNIWDYTPLENTLQEWLFAQQLGAEHVNPEDPVINFSAKLNENNKPELSWIAPDDGIEKDEYIWAYQIYRDAELLETVDRDSMRFIDLDAEPGTSYSYSVAPMNYFFLEAPASEEITVPAEEEIINSLNSSGISDNVAIYPNPVSNTLYFNYDGSIQNASYQLFSLQGRLIKQDPVISESIDLSGIENGMYLLKLDLDGKMTNLRIIKNSE